MLLLLRWPRELNALHLKKTRANRKSTSKLIKHLHQFDNTCSAKVHNATKYRNTLQIAQTTTEMFQGDPNKRRT